MTYITKDKNIAKVVVIIAIAFTLATPVLAHTVTMNLRFAIQDNSDSIRVNQTNYISPITANFQDISKRYVLAEREGTVSGLVFAGAKLLGIAMDKTSAPYLLKMIQNDDSNRFIIPVTSQTWQDIDATHSLSPDRIPSKSIGNVSASLFPSILVLQLTFENIDLSGPIGPGNILIQNIGKSRVPKIQMKVIG